MAGMNRQRLDATRLGLAIATTLTALPLAAFFGFVGYMKTFASLTTLAQHRAWTTALPEWLGRAIGISELLCAIGLIAALSLRGRLVWAPWLALVLVINQIAAAAVHANRGELDALPQNAVLIALLMLCGTAARLWCRRARGG